MTRMVPRGFRARPKRIDKAWVPFICATAIAAAMAAPAAHGRAATILDFDSLTHGEVVSDQMRDSHGLIVSGDNYSRSFDLVAAFDTTLRHTRDGDLEDPWSGGNLPANADLGRVLIIQENDDRRRDGLLKRPDDEGHQPAGDLIFDFLAPVSLFGFDLIDVEDPLSEPGAVSFFSAGHLLRQIAFNDFVTPGDFYDSTIEFGDNTANRIAPITAAAINARGFDRVVIHMGGSGAVDNLVVPEPATAALLVFGALGLLRHPRRRTSCLGPYRPAVIV